MIHVRCAEQMSAMLLFQTMPVLGQTFVRTVPPVSATGLGAGEPMRLVASRAIEQSKRSTPNARVQGAVTRNSRLVLPKGAVASHIQCARKFTAFRTGGEQTLRAC
jgi:hypothetical protein